MSEHGPDYVNPKFLAALDPDPVAAEKAYRLLYRKLYKFLEWKGCPCPDDLAQESLTRAFHGLDNGTEIYSAAPSSFFLGFARNVLLEWRKKKREDQIDPESFAEVPARAVNSSDDRILLETLLKSLSKDDRELLNEWAHAEDWPGFAERRGQSVNALNIRAFRIRQSLRKKFDLHTRSAKKKTRKTK